MRYCTPGRCGSRHDLDVLAIELDHLRGHHRDRLPCHVYSTATLGRIRLGEEDCVSKKGKCLPGAPVVGAWEIRLSIKLRCAVQDLALDRVPASEPEDER